MFSNLVNAVSSVTSKISTATSSAFPYTIGEEIAEWKGCSLKNGVWTLLEGTHNTTKEKVTIFAIENRKTITQNRVDAALNCLNKLKTIRHPNILEYTDSLVTDDKIYLVTEYVYPLLACIENVGDANKINDSFIALCLHQISDALSFVHNNLQSVHCLVSPLSIFINQAGDFKLGSFELSHKYKNIPSHFLANFDLLPTKYRPKELSNGSSDAINILMKNPIHSIDAWCIGCIIFELFNSSTSSMNDKHIKFTKPQQLSNIQSIPYNLQSFYKRLLATKPSSRLSLSLLLSDCDFIKQNSLVQTSIFLTEIAIKSDAEKRQFLQHLDKNIESYPASICKYKILPTLTHLLQHGFGANPLILSCVLKISSSFMTDENEKASKIKPVVINMFKNNERGTRINLLKSLPKFISYLDSKTISHDIWPQLINGFTDSSPVLREQSVRSVIHFTPKLEDNIVSTQLLPLLDKIQSNDVEPAIRTNICIVLGKIAKFVNLTNNQQNELLLVKCFGRALNDKFTPCRNAALQSFSATIQLFQPNTIATKILPYIIKYTCDPYKSVRDSSFKCIEIGLQKLKQHALTLPDKPMGAEDANKQQTAQQSQSAASSSSGAASSSSSYLGNMTSWASRMSGYGDNTNHDGNDQDQDKDKNESKDNEPNGNNMNNMSNRNGNKSNHDKPTDLDDLFGDNDKSNNDHSYSRKSGMQLKSNKKEKENEDVSNEKDKPQMDSLDDFLASFNEDLNKMNKKKDDDVAKSKIKYKNKNKKSKKSKKTKSKTKAKPKQEKTDNADDFFDDW